MTTIKVPIREAVRSELRLVLRLVDVVITAQRDVSRTAAEGAPEHGWLTTAEAAERLRMGKGILENRRVAERGSAYRRIGRAVR